MKWLAGILMRGFGRRYDYDVGYMEEYAQASPGGFLRYLLASPLVVYRKRAPEHVYFVAKLVATQRSDCGPCLRLVYNMAREARVDAQVLLAALQDDAARLAEPQLAEEVGLIIRFAQAVLDHATLDVAELGERIIERWNQATLNEVAGAIAFGQFFPTFKRGLLKAQACEPVVAELVALNG